MKEMRLFQHTESFACITDSFLRKYQSRFNSAENVASEQ